MPVSPLPPRAGISANRLRAPGGPQTHARSGDPVPATVGEWLRAEFPGASDADIAGLLRQSDEPPAGRLCDEAGRPVSAEDPVVPGGFYWFHRPVPLEERIPFEIGIVHEDADLLVVDKPHFLASTPNGRFVRECVVTRLRVEREEPDLVAIHRLDRVTAGLLVLSRRPETRGAYQRLFQDRAVDKTYRALAAVPAGFDPSGFPVERRTRLEKEPGTRQMLEVPGEPNAHSTVEYLGLAPHVPGGPDVPAVPDVHVGPVAPDVPGRPDSPGTPDAHRTTPRPGDGRGARGIGEFRLTPHTGRTHQLRVHMNGLGLPILGDPVYPVDLAPDSYDFSSPLQLLADRLAFTDPLTGTPREFASRLTLSGASG